MPVLVGGDPGYVGIDFPFDFPYYGGVAQPIVPPLAPYSISIAGRNYLVDTSFEPYRREAFRHRSIQAQKANITVNNEPGEGTVDTQSFWRRLAEDWSLGSGQLYFDRRNSVANRFRQSKGVDVWTQWQLTLLSDTVTCYSSDNARIIPCQAGDYLYVLDDNTVKFTSTLDPLTWTEVSNVPNDLTDIATNGYDVWVASPTEGLFHTAAGATTFDTYMATGPMTYVGFTGDRLMSSFGPAVYNIENLVSPVIAELSSALVSGTTYAALPVSATTADISEGDSVVIWHGIFNQTFTASAFTATGATSIPVDPAVALYDFPASSTTVAGVTPLWTHPNAEWIWPSFQYGSTEIYLAGYPATNPPGTGAVYRTTVEQTGGIDLIVPVIALPLEGGEYPVSLGGYLNLIMVGTNLGLRVCETLAIYDPTGNAGDLKSGPLLPSTIQPVTQPVNGIVGNGRFIWFTWQDFDSQSSGLGRCDLSHFIDELAPAYASDLMVSEQPDYPIAGAMYLDWCTISNSPVFSVPGLGLFIAAPTLVPGGYIDSGLITYGIPDNKIAMQLSYRNSGAGVIEAQVSVEPLITPDFDNDAVMVAPPENTYGTSIPGQAAIKWPLPQLTGEYFELRTEMFNPGNRDAPVISRWMLESIPGVTAGVEISIVLTLFDKVEDKGILAPINAYLEYLFMEDLRIRQQPIAYVEGPMVFPVCTIDSLDWIPHSEDDSTPTRGYKPDLVVYLKTWQPPTVVNLPTAVS